MKIIEFYSLDECNEYLKNNKDKIIQVLPCIIDFVEPNGGNDPKYYFNHRYQLLINENE